MTELALPCVRCRKRSGYRFPEIKPRYRYRCPGCATVYAAEMVYVRNRKAFRRRTLPLGGLFGVLAAATFTYSHFELTVRNQDGSGGERQVAFYALNPFKDMETFTANDSIALVYQAKDLVAVAHMANQEWVITRAGGLEGLKGLNPFAGGGPG